LWIELERRERGTIATTQTNAMGGTVDNLMPGTYMRSFQQQTEWFFEGSPRTPGTRGCDERNQRIENVTLKSVQTRIDFANAESEFSACLPSIAMPDWCS